MQGIAHQNRVIRLPMHVHNLLNSVRRAKRELEANDGPEPTDSQVKTLKNAHTACMCFQEYTKGGTPRGVLPHLDCLIGSVVRCP